MKKKERIEWLLRLADACGPSGFEGPVKEVLRERLAAFPVTYDKLGSAVFCKAGREDQPKVMLASHMDEVGFLVKHITKEGFLRFACLGGWWDQVLLSQRVIVHGKKGDLIGVIGSKPPHILAPEERSKMVKKQDMYIDVGAADREEAEELGVYVGCPVTPDVKAAAMGKGKVLVGKAFDNRVGCAVMADVLEAAAAAATPNTVYGVATVQEEVGLRGAQTSASLLSPDIALVLDTCVAGGTPGVAEEVAPAVIGKGVAITVYDASMIPNTALRDLAVKTAEEEKIPIQFSVSEGGGTDGGRISLSNSGVLTLTFSIPTRYIHSHQSVIHVDDYLGAVKLISALLKKLDAACYEQLLKQ